MDTSINLRLNAGQARSEAENARQSVESLVESFEKLKGEGNWSGAADLVRKIQETQSASLQQATSYSAGGSSAVNYAGSAAQAIKSLEMRIETLTRVSEELAEQLEKAAEGGDYRASFNLSATLNNVDQERRQLQAEKARLEGRLNDSKDGLEGAVSTASLTRVLDLISSGVHVSSSYRQAMAQGDYIGAGIQAKQGVGNIFSGAGTALITAGAVTANPILMGIGLGSKGIGYVMDWLSSKESAEKAEAEAFQRSLVPTHGLNRLFYNGSYGENNARAAALIGTGTNAAAGTGLETYEFLQLAAGYSSYGAKSINEAIEQTRQAALFANTTGADINGTLSFLGTMRRFGDTGDVLGIANYARGAMGMEKGQTDEFLSSLSRVIEEGIANGYVRSTADVAATMTMFYRLSDNNPLWQGKYGAERLSRINSGISGSTALSDASDVMVYGAAKAVFNGLTENEKKDLLGGKPTGTWIDYMMLMERGMDARLFEQLGADISAMEGEGNVEGQIARWMKVTGSNWTMGKQLYEMWQNLRTGGAGNAELQKFLDDYNAAPKEDDYTSYLTVYQEKLNAIAGGIAGMSESDFVAMLGKLDDIEGKTEEKRTAAEEKRREEELKDFNDKFIEYLFSKEITKARKRGDDAFIINAARESDMSGTSDDGLRSLALLLSTNEANAAMSEELDSLLFQTKNNRSYFSMDVLNAMKEAALDNGGINTAEGFVKDVSHEEVMAMIAALNSESGRAAILEQKLEDIKKILQDGLRVEEEG